MEQGFWKRLKKPFFVLAPMANVTDAAFRRIIAKYGKPDVFWTEFVSANGLVSKGKKKLLVDLWYAEEERPIVAQIFSGNPESIKKAAALIQELGFDGLDLNMGCPDKDVEKTGAGAAHIKEPALAQEVIYAAKEGAPNIPISVKTRIGYKKNEMEIWLPKILETKPVALTVHLRTREEMSKVPAHWELAKEVVSIRNGSASPETLIIGNGDIDTLQTAKEKAEESGMDGIMVGRGIFGNPWFFSGHAPSTEEKLRVLVEHTELYESLYRSEEPYLKNFDVMKKHYKAYVSDFPGSKELRIELMAAKNASEVEDIIKNFKI